VPPLQARAAGFLPTGAYTERGIKGPHGFMADEVVDKAKHMHPVPRAIADIAVLTEPLMIAEKALNELEPVLTRMPWIDPKKAEKRGMNAVVLGAGPVGLLAALALLVRGFDTPATSRESAKSLARRVDRERGRALHRVGDPPRRPSSASGRQRRPDPRSDRLGCSHLRGPARDRRERR
jgi:hypothetical protein